VKNDFAKFSKEMNLTLMRGSHSTYARVFLNTWFPKLDRILLIDSDTLVLGDIEPLWNEDMSKNAIGAVPDIAMYSKYSNFEDNDLINELEIYYNMGIVLCNLDFWRKNDLSYVISQKIMQYDRSFKIADQSILNYAIPEYIKRIHLKYNYYSAVHGVNYKALRKVFSEKLIFSEHEFIEAKEDPVIVHLVGHSFERPWYKKSTSIFKSTYLKYRRETIWGKTSLLKNKKQKNLIIKSYDYLIYLLLKLHLFNFTLKVRYLIVQKIKNSINIKRK
jgi:lipopolysaccharide biosynthesis glycosyltransferase